MFKYSTFCAARKRSWYAYSVVGSKTPAELQKPLPKGDLIRLIREFSNDGEINNSKAAFACFLNRGMTFNYRTGGKVHGQMRLFPASN